MWCQERGLVVICKAKPVAVKWETSQQVTVRNYSGKYSCRRQWLFQSLLYPVSTLLLVEVDPYHLLEIKF